MTYDEEPCVACGGPVEVSRDDLGQPISGVDPWDRPICEDDYTDDLYPYGATA